MTSVVGADIGVPADEYVLPDRIRYPLIASGQHFLGRYFGFGSRFDYDSAGSLHNKVAEIRRHAATWAEMGGVPGDGNWVNQHTESPPAVENTFDAPVDYSLLLDTIRFVREIRMWMKRGTGGNMGVSASRVDDANNSRVFAWHSEGTDVVWLASADPGFVVRATNGHVLNVDDVVEVVMRRERTASGTGFRWVVYVDGVEDGEWDTASFDDCDFAGLFERDVDEDRYYEVMVRTA